MNELIINTGKEFTSELRKDLPFFSLSGGLIGVLMLIHSSLRKKGITSDGSWPSELFSDFVSFQAYGLMFIGVLMSGSAAVCISRAGFPFNIFHDSAEHLKLRLRQVTSSVVAFTFGIFLVSLCHSIFDGSIEGAALAILIVCFNLMLVSGLFSSALFLHLVENSKYKAAPYFALGISVLMLAYLVLYGASGGSS